MIVCYSTMIKTSIIFLIFIASVWGVEKRPNVVFLFADDLGYRDLACYGHPYAKTPALDQLASEGTRFMQAYAAGQTCSPSRTGIMTGRTPYSFPKPTPTFGLQGRITVTELLHNAGYATGHFGKWHIGDKDAHYNRPSGIYGIDVNDRCGPVNLYKKVIAEGRDGPIFESAIDFIRQNKNRPFYVNVWGFSTHFPVFSHPKHLAEFRDTKVRKKDFAEPMQEKFQDCVDIGGNIGDSMRQYLANVYALDQNVKMLLDALDEMGLRENTIVVFSSDQGPEPVRLEDGRYNRNYVYKEGDENMLGYAGELRGGKHSVYEGGLRIPFIVRWPGNIEAGRVDSDSVTCGVDWLPTICKLAGVTDVPQDIDGEDVSDIWLGTTRERTKPLFWNGFHGLTIRDGKWRYYKSKSGDELYDIPNDPGETENLAEHYPAVVADLKQKSLAWRATLPRPEK